MSAGITESEWKVFRKVHAAALERYCEKVLSEINNLTADASRTYHERYLAVYELVEDCDDQLAGIFNNPRRSVAFQQLLMMRAQALLTEDEFAQFRPETRDAIETVLRF